jgi:tryptophanyl-tRNA synthetase
LAAGIDPEVCTLFLQSHVPSHQQLAWILECSATFGELKRMTQFKDKSGDQESVRVGLFTYPILMAADILLYDADEVPVGDDQRQHLELTREIAHRFNNRYGQTFVVPTAMIPKVGARVMDLQHPERKMSKSVNSPLGTIGILDDASEIEKKIKKAVTDNDGSVSFDAEKKPGLANLLTLLGACISENPEEISQRYERYGDLKNDVAEALIETLRPLQERYQTFSADRPEVLRILHQGARKARDVAEVTYQRASDAVGLVSEA